MKIELTDQEADTLEHALALDVHESERQIEALQADNTPTNQRLIASMQERNALLKAIQVKLQTATD